MTTPIDPALVEAIKAIGARMPPLRPAPGAVSDVQLRRDALQAVYGQLRAEACGPVRGVQIPSPGEPIPARLYWPIDGRPHGLFVWFHGGAWLAGGIDSHDSMCRILTNRSRAAVLNVDYRLAPEHPFPCGLDDAINAVRWAAQHRDELGADSGAMAVGGDSAGATFSAVVAIDARDRGGPAIARQVLVYPATDMRMDTPSWHEYGLEAYGLSRAEVTWSMQQYAADISDWRASPLLADRLDGVAPATIITAECDPLRDEAEQYADRLRAAGVEVGLHRFAGMVHGFVGLVGVQASDDALTLIADDVAAAVDTTATQND